MPHHVVGFSGLVDKDGYRVIPAAADGVLTQRNGGHVCSYPLFAFGCWVGATGLRRARIVTPSLRATGLSQIRPFEQNISPSTDPPLLALMMRQPIPLLATEEITLEADHSFNPNTTVYGVFFLARRFERAPSAPIVVLRATSATAAVAGQWTPLSLAWDDEASQLPPGTWGIIGAECASTGGIAFRLSTDADRLRPGGLCMSSVSGQTAPCFYDSRLGVWSRFSPPALPTLEIFSSAATSSHTLFLQLIRLDGEFAQRQTVGDTHIIVTAES